MAGWPESPRLIGKNIARMDGLAKASGRAKYPSDERPKGMLFGVVLYSPHAHAVIKKLDIEPAKKMPGVKAVLAMAKEGATVRYHGEDIAAIAAETEEQARDGARAIVVEYEVLPHCATEAQALAEGAPEIVKGQGIANNRRSARAQVTGDPEDAMNKADAVVEGIYSVPVINHVCLEPHGLCISVGEDKATAWASTQSVIGTAGDLAGALGLPATDVTVLTEVMGGGFGSKFNAETWGIAAAKLAKEAKRPVAIFLDRTQEQLAGGNRPSATGKIKMGGTKDGTITSVIGECYGTGGITSGFDVIIPYVYDVKNRSNTNTSVFVNAANQRAWRAPRHPQSCVLTEFAVDDLAEKLGLNPLDVRLKNLPETNLKEVYTDQAKIGAKLIGWDRWKPRAENAKSARGPLRRGLGMALHTWGGGGAAGKQVTCTISPDGSVEVRSATQDIGTGARTVLAIIAAEVLGLEVADIRSNIGNSTFPPGQGSGGSTTTASMAPPAFDAVNAARDAFFKKVASSYDAKPEELSLAGGKLLVKGEPKATWKEACRKLGVTPISVTPEGRDGAGLRELTSSGVGGCQFAEVVVDSETGVVKVAKMVAVQDSGLIIDMLTWKSQMYGGVIMGINGALFEERVMDPVSGRCLNADMELYKLAGATDIPEIVVEPYQTEAMKKRGVIGIGEPATIGTMAAIGNAVANALGVRVPHFPMSPMNVLTALASQG
ncbi:MAG: xanthine dehydrogenase family protein molybdopterin-binding subunit [Isosphaeraceae bacterium]